MLTSLSHRFPITAILLAGLLSGFCAGAVVEVAEGESASECEELVIERRAEERETRENPHRAFHNLLGSRTEIASVGVPSRQIYSSEHSLRNGMGGPLTL